jgi:AraC-like DNA-binding protein
MLLSGQIRRYFFLENTGVSGMVGIKLMPAATYALFGQEMVSLTDNVVPITTVTDRIPSLAILDEALTPEERISSAQRWIETLLPDIRHREVARLSNVTDHIIEKKGMVDIESVALTHHITRRHLEREFKRVIGLSPKYFARIIQFNYIFEAMQTQDNTWVDVALNSGYFDQSHFIRNFKAFTGESPSQYGFDKQNMANFFLRK